MEGRHLSTLRWDTTQYGRRLGVRNNQPRPVPTDHLVSEFADRR